MRLILKLLACHIELRNEPVLCSFLVLRHISMQVHGSSVHVAPPGVRLASLMLVALVLDLEQEVERPL